MKNSTNKKQIIFTAGLPGAGKSTVLNNSIYNELKRVDCDEFKKSHPQYNPKAPELVHEWSVVKAREYQFSLLAKGESFIVDGTGTNIEKYIKWFQEGRELGFEIVVLYVKVDLATSIKRNQNRERSVPVTMILEKAAIIDDCMNVLGSVADKFEIVENN
jgi:predicted ABC-type ATPase